MDSFIKRVVLEMQSLDSTIYTIVETCRGSICVKSIENSFLGSDIVDI